ncbi:4-hydroxy-tetrahydrodipicolinate synthase [Rhodanobacter glycinis]|uniref:4-hydroxy-tetrahydrodipicolinate synthase n=1 Tax=Rhodanobacter glycinis TaxID=582702 RepID=A0A502FKN4_9GAMM|nr:4-hydroxy-tetrahydrodipicolinate synthase [Rhodanobacter glycinis]TPG04493.1 4-hydroxy-tetrahydrodipicolinate synthase [Rhodanobacter glycinis]TPG49971.1 4-hydroxy-tetrahydrodipicolinate synthase [Rhodanobacter glycinis]
MNIRGSICALVTPFAADGALDLAAFGRLLDHQLAGGTQALVVAGSTGEAHMLEPEEFDRLLTFAIEHVAGRVPVIAGTGEAGTAKTVAMTRRARALGADAALVVVPYYVRPTQEGLYRHYLEVAEHGGLPLLLYNVPTRTGCDLLPQTVARLREHPGIIGIKEARGDHERISALAELVRPDFVYLSGDDGSAGEAMLAGAAGTISVVANLVPQAFRALCDAAIDGDQAVTERCHAALQPLVQALNCAPNPIAVKAGLPILGLGLALPRLPLVELNDGPDRARLHQALSSLASLATVAG